jgi:hypothetical protein
LSGSISQAGIAAVLGFLLSWVVEWWPGFVALEARAKRLAIFVLCLLIGLALLGLSRAVGCAPGIVIEDVWSALAAGFAAFVASQAAHTRSL